MSKNFTVLITLITMIFLGTIVATADDPTVGPINPATSIIGEADGDSIGAGGIRVLPSGNLVIVSPSWSGSRGAVTCLTPAEYQAGGVVVNASNSLVGGSADNKVGTSVTILSNGNYVVVSQQWDDGVNTNVGAVTWVNGDTCIPFNEITRNTTVNATNSIVGSTTNDGVALKAVALLNGRYTVVFPEWDNGPATNAGAIKGCVATTGCAGSISAGNALVGSSIDDKIGVGTAVIVLSDGDYVAHSRLWNGGRGFARWCSGTIGCVGTIDASNALVGSSVNDWVGITVTALPNGHYVSLTAWWDDPAGVTDAGAATWCHGTTGCVGTVSAANSLIGSHQNDFNGSSGAIALSNGNYFFKFLGWDNGTTENAGAVVWCDGAIGCTGTVSAANALIGSNTDDYFGQESYLLNNGNFLVGSEQWDNGLAVDAGAVAWCNGTTGTGCKGVVGVATALVGSTTNDKLGTKGVPLSNGNFVIPTGNWDNPSGGIVNAGAVTFMNGTTGLVGAISASNSMVGSQANDKVGLRGVFQLANGNYVVASPEWNNDVFTRAGAATWVNGATGFNGTVTAANSLVGDHADAYVGIGGVVALTNGNYVVESPFWGHSGLLFAGAVTWGDGTTGIVGVVSMANSAFGATEGEKLGFLDTVALPNGNYIINSTNWGGGGTANYTGAIRWGDGEGGTVGGLDATNSMVGSQEFDGLLLQPFILPNGDYIIYMPNWDNGGIVNAGAIRRGSGTDQTTGLMDNSNALLGISAGELTGATFIIRPDNSFFISIPNWNNLTGVVVYSPGPENLLKNPSFETAGSPAKYPVNWKTSLSALAGDKRICDKPAKPITRTDGKCIFQFNSLNVAPKARTLKQFINNPVWGTAGNVLTLTADVEGLKVGPGSKKIILNVTFDNNTRDVATLTIPTGTYDYTTLIGTVKLTRAVKKVVVVLNPGTSKGRIRIDNLFLSVSAAPSLRFPSLSEQTTRDGANPFDLPAAPDGFRN